MDNMGLYHEGIVRPPDAGIVGGGEVHIRVHSWWSVWGKVL